MFFLQAKPGPSRILCWNSSAARHCSLIMTETAISTCSKSRALRSGFIVTMQGIPDVSRRLAIWEGAPDRHGAVPALCPRRHLLFHLPYRASAPITMMATGASRMLLTNQIQPILTFLYLFLLAMDHDGDLDVSSRSMLTRPTLQKAAVSETRDNAS